MDYLQRSLTIKEQTGDLYFICNTLGQIGTVYNRLGQHEKALEIAKQLLTISTEIQTEERLSDAHKLLHITYASLQNYQEAYYHYHEFFTYYSKMQNEDSRKRMEQLSTAFDLQNAQREAEMERLRSKTLEQEVELKSKELTTLALTLAQKNETLSKLREQLNSVRKNDYDLQENQSLKNVDRELSLMLTSENAWQVFEQQFHNIHHDFIQKLSKQYPAMSPIELRVCALMKIHLSTKEIANMLCVETKSVEMYRYRIRKKLSLDVTVNLSTFLAAM